MSRIEASLSLAGALIDARCFSAALENSGSSPRSTIASRAIDARRSTWFSVTRRTLSSFAMQVAAAGDRALLLTLSGASAARLRAAAGAVRAIHGVVAAIIGHESVYVVGTTDRDAVISAVESAGEQSAGATSQHRIEVSFAPEHALDLDALVVRAEVARADVIARIA